MSDGEGTILDELAKSKFSIALFANLLGVQGHPGQLRFWKTLMARNETRWRPEYLTVCLSSGNRAGKTLALAVAVLHHCVHKTGMRPPDQMNDRELDTWLRAPYHWFHFGIQQEVGDLLWKEIVMLLEGRHPAQKGRGCPLVDALGAIAATDTKERGEYRWVRLNPILGGAEIHFRTTNEKAVGSLGQDMNGISYDECGLDPNLYFVVNEVLHMRRLGTGGPLVMISTPSEGFSGFADEWLKGDPINPQREPYRISLRMSTRDNIGYGIDQGTFDRLVQGYPETLIPQNIDGYFIEGKQAFFNHDAVDRAFDATYHDEEAVKGEAYVQGVDPAMRYDATWSITLHAKDGNGTGVYAVRRKGKQKIVDVVAMVREAHELYSDGATCITGLDTTGMGGHMFREMVSDIAGLRNVEFGGTRSKKMKLLTDTKALLEQGRLRFPREGVWLELRRQLLGYRLDPLKGDRGQATDAVMALAVAAKMLLSRPEGSTEDAPFDYWAGAVEEVEPGYHRRKTTALDRELALRDNVVTSRMGG